MLEKLLGVPPHVPHACTGTWHDAQEEVKRHEHRCIMVVEKLGRVKMLYQEAKAENEATAAQLLATQQDRAVRT